MADLIREDEIDILVDLALHANKNRLTVFARKPAPVQMTFAGYPGTTGLSAIDYRLTDPYLDAPGAGDGFYAEKSLRLADTFWCYDPLGARVEVNELPAIKNGFVTFGCLNDLSKINEVVGELWAPIFEAVRDSRLLLLAPRGPQREEAARAVGLSPERVVFVEPCERERYLQIYHGVDISLDTFPYNGHTTSLAGFLLDGGSGHHACRGEGGIACGGKSLDEPGVSTVYIAVAGGFFSNGNGDGGGLGRARCAATGVAWEDDEFRSDGWGGICEGHRKRLSVRVERMLCGG